MIAGKYSDIVLILVRLNNSVTTNGRWTLRPCQCQNVWIILPVVFILAYDGLIVIFLAYVTALLCLFSVCDPSILCIFQRMRRLYPCFYFSVCDGHIQRPHQSGRPKLFSGCRPACVPAHTVHVSVQQRATRQCWRYVTSNIRYVFEAL